MGGVPSVVGATASALRSAEASLLDDATVARVLSDRLQASDAEHHPPHTPPRPPDPHFADTQAALDMWPVDSGQPSRLPAIDKLLGEVWDANRPQFDDVLRRRVLLLRHVLHSARASMEALPSDAPAVTPPVVPPPAPAVEPAAPFLSALTTMATSHLRLLARLDADGAVELLRTLDAQLEEAVASPGDALAAAFVGRYVSTLQSLIAPPSSQLACAALASAVHVTLRHGSLTQLLCLVDHLTRASVSVDAGSVASAVAAARLPQTRDTAVACMTAASHLESFTVDVVEGAPPGGTCDACRASQRATAPLQPGALACDGAHLFVVRPHELLKVSRRTAEVVARTPYSPCLRRSQIVAFGRSVVLLYTPQPAEGLPVLAALDPATLQVTGVPTGALHDHLLASTRVQLLSDGGHHVMVASYHGGDTGAVSVAVFDMAAGTSGRLLRTTPIATNVNVCGPLAVPGVEVSTPPSVTPLPTTPPDALRCGVDVMDSRPTSRVATRGRVASWTVAAIAAGPLWFRVWRHVVGDTYSLVCQQRVLVPAPGCHTFPGDGCEVAPGDCVGVFELGTVAGAAAAGDMAPLVGQVCRPRAEHHRWALLPDSTRLPPAVSCVLDQPLPAGPSMSFSLASDVLYTDGDSVGVVAAGDAASGPPHWRPSTPHTCVASLADGTPRRLATLDLAGWHPSAACYDEANTCVWAAVLSPAPAPAPSPRRTPAASPRSDVSAPPPRPTSTLTFHTFACDGGAPSWVVPQPSPDAAPDVPHVVETLLCVAARCATSVARSERCRREWFRARSGRGSTAPPGLVPGASLRVAVGDSWAGATLVGAHPSSSSATVCLEGDRVVKLPVSAIVAALPPPSVLDARPVSARLAVQLEDQTFTLLEALLEWGVAGRHLQCLAAATHVAAANLQLLSCASDVHVSPDALASLRETLFHVSSVAHDAACPAVVDLAVAALASGFDLFFPDAVSRVGVLRRCLFGCGSPSEPARAVPVVVYETLFARMQPPGTAPGDLLARFFGGEAAHRPLLAAFLQDAVRATLEAVVGALTGSPPPGGVNVELATDALVSLQRSLLVRCFDDGGLAPVLAPHATSIIGAAATALSHVSAAVSPDGLAALNASFVVRAVPVLLAALCAPSVLPACPAIVPSSQCPALAAAATDLACALDACVAALSGLPSPPRSRSLAGPKPLAARPLARPPPAGPTVSVLKDTLHASVVLCGVLLQPVVGSAARSPPGHWLTDALFAGGVEANHATDETTDKLDASREEEDAKSAPHEAQFLQQVATASPSAGTGSVRLWAHYHQLIAHDTAKRTTSRNKFRAHGGRTWGLPGVDAAEAATAAALMKHLGVLPTAVGAFRGAPSLPRVGASTPAATVDKTFKALKTSTPDAVLDVFRAARAVRRWVRDETTERPSETPKVAPPTTGAQDELRTVINTVASGVHVRALALLKVSPAADAAGSALASAAVPPSPGIKSPGRLWQSVQRHCGVATPLAAARKSAKTVKDRVLTFVTSRDVDPGAVLATAHTCEASVEGATAALSLFARLLHLRGAGEAALRALGGLVLPRRAGDGDAVDEGRPLLDVAALGALGVRAHARAALHRAAETVFKRLLALHARALEDAVPHGRAVPAAVAAAAAASPGGVFGFSLDAVPVPRSPPPALALAADAAPPPPDSDNVLHLLYALLPAFASAPPGGSKPSAVTRRVQLMQALLDSVEVHADVDELAPWTPPGSPQGSDAGDDGDITKLLSVHASSSSQDGRPDGLLTSDHWQSQPATPVPSSAGGAGGPPLCSLEFTLPPGSRRRFRCLRLCLADFGPCSPRDIVVSVSLVPGGADRHGAAGMRPRPGEFRGGRCLTLPLQSGWVTVLHRRHLASFGVMPTDPVARVRVDVIRNYQGGLSTRLCGVRLLQTPPVAPPTLPFSDVIGSCFHRIVVASVAGAPPAATYGLAQSTVDLLATTTEVALLGCGDGCDDPRLVHVVRAMAGVAGHPAVRQGLLAPPRFRLLLRLLRHGSLTIKVITMRLLRGLFVEQAPSQWRSVLAASSGDAAIGGDVVTVMLDFVARGVWAPGVPLAPQQWEVDQADACVGQEDSKTDAGVELEHKGAADGKPCAADGKAGELEPPPLRRVRSQLPEAASVVESVALAAEAVMLLRHLAGFPHWRPALAATCLEAVNAARSWLESPTLRRSDAPAVLASVQQAAAALVVLGGHREAIRPGSLAKWTEGAAVNAVFQDSGAAFAQNVVVTAVDPHVGATGAEPAGSDSDTGSDSDDDSGGGHPASPTGCTVAQVVLADDVSGDVPTTVCVPVGELRGEEELPPPAALVPLRDLEAFFGLVLPPGSGAANRPAQAAMYSRLARLGLSSAFHELRVLASRAMLRQLELCAAQLDGGVNHSSALAADAWVHDLARAPGLLGAVLSSAGVALSPAVAGVMEAFAEPRPGGSGLGAPDPPLDVGALEAHVDQMLFLNAHPRQAASLAKAALGVKGGVVALHLAPGALTPAGVGPAVVLAPSAKPDAVPTLVCGAHVLVAPGASAMGELAEVAAPTVVPASSTLLVVVPMESVLAVATSAPPGGLSPPITPRRGAEASGGSGADGARSRSGTAYTQDSSLGLPAGPSAVGEYEWGRVVRCRLSELGTVLHTCGHQAVVVTARREAAVADPSTHLDAALPHDVLTGLETVVHAAAADGWLDRSFPSCVVAVSEADGAAIEASSTDLHAWCQRLSAGAVVDVRLPVTGQWHRGVVYHTVAAPFSRWLRVAVPDLPLEMWRWVERIATSEGGAPGAPSVAPDGSVRWGADEVAPPGWHTSWTAVPDSLALAGDMGTVGARVEAGLPAAATHASAVAAVTAWRNSLSINDMVDCLDTHGKWYEARIMGARDNNEQSVKVRFLGWSSRANPSRWDEWLSRDSPRLFPPGSKARLWRRVQVGDYVEMSNGQNFHVVTVTAVHARDGRVGVVDGQQAVWRRVGDADTGVAGVQDGGGWAPPQLHSLEDYHLFACYGSRDRNRAAWSLVDSETPLELPVLPLVPMGPPVPEGAPLGGLDVEDRLPPTAAARMCNPLTGESMASGSAASTSTSDTPHRLVAAAVELQGGSGDVHTVLAAHGGDAALAVGYALVGDSRGAAGAGVAKGLSPRRPSTHPALDIMTVWTRGPWMATAEAPLQYVASAASSLVVLGAGATLVPRPEVCTEPLPPPQDDGALGAALAPFIRAAVEAGNNHEVALPAPLAAMSVSMWLRLDAPVDGRTTHVLLRQRHSDHHGQLVFPLDVGTSVWAKFHGAGWYPGRVSTVNPDGTYDIQYDDGDRESGVVEANLRHRDWQRRKKQKLELQLLPDCSLAVRLKTDQQDGSRLAFLNVDDSSDKTLHGKSRLTVGTWVHVVVAVGSDHMALYCDGQPEGALPVQAFARAAALELGPPKHGSRPPAAVRSLAVYDSCLSSSQVALDVLGHRRAAKPPTPTPAVHMTELEFLEAHPSAGGALLAHLVAGGDLPVACLHRAIEQAGGDVARGAGAVAATPEAFRLWAAAEHRKCGGASPPPPPPAAAGSPSRTLFARSPRRGSSPGGELAVTGRSVQVAPFVRGGRPAVRDAPQPNAAASRAAAVRSAAVAAVKALRPSSAAPAVGRLRLLLAPQPRGPAWKFDDGGDVAAAEAAIADRVAFLHVAIQKSKAIAHVLGRASTLSAAWAAPQQAPPPAEAAEPALVGNGDAIRAAARAMRGEAMTLAEALALAENIVGQRVAAAGARSTLASHSMLALHDGLRRRRARLEGGDAPPSAGAGAATRAAPVPAGPAGSPLRRRRASTSPSVFGSHSLARAMRHSIARVSASPDSLRQYTHMCATTLHLVYTQLAALQVVAMWPLMARPAAPSASTSLIACVRAAAGGTLPVPPPRGIHAYRAWATAPPPPPAPSLSPTRPPSEAGSTTGWDASTPSPHVDLGTPVLSAMRHRPASLQVPPPLPLDLGEAPGAVVAGGGGGGPPPARRPVECGPVTRRTLVRWVIVPLLQAEQLVAMAARPGSRLVPPDTEALPDASSPAGGAHSVCTALVADAVGQLALVVAAHVSAEAAPTAAERATARSSAAYALDVLSVLFAELTPPAGRGGGAAGGLAGLLYTSKVFELLQQVLGVVHPSLLSPVLDLLSRCLHRPDLYPETDLPSLRLLADLEQEFEVLLRGKALAAKQVFQPVFLQEVVSLLAVASTAGEAFARRLRSVGYALEGGAAAPGASETIFRLKAAMKFLDCCEAGASVPPAFLADVLSTLNVPDTLPTFIGGTSGRPSCGAGVDCVEITSEEHIDAFVHPCPDGAACTATADEVHMRRFVHLMPNNTYLDELPFFNSHCDHGAVSFAGCFNFSFGHNALSVGGREFTRSIGMHANSHICYTLDGMYTRLTARCAINDSASGHAIPDCYFAVEGDGRILWQSPPLAETGAFLDCDVSVAGVSSLSLVCTACPTPWAHTAWIEPVLTRAVPPGGPTAAGPPLAAVAHPVPPPPAAGAGVEPRPVTPPRPPAAPARALSTPDVYTPHPGAVAGTAAPKWTLDMDQALVVSLNTAAARLSRPAVAVKLDELDVGEAFVRAPRLRHLPHTAVLQRVKLLQDFNRLFTPLLPFINLAGGAQGGSSSVFDPYLPRIRRTVTVDTKRHLRDAVLAATKTPDTKLTVTLNRFQAVTHASCTVFRQLMRQMGGNGQALVALRSASPTSRPWHVKLVGESGMDMGGPFNSSLTQAVVDVMSVGSHPGAPLFLPSPNQRAQTGLEQDLYVVNPAAGSSLHLAMYEFFGRLIGMALRMNFQLDLQLPGTFWKALLGDPTTLQDLESVDHVFVTHVMELRKASAEFLSDVPFTVILSNGDVRELVPGGNRVMVTPDTVSEYVSLACDARLREAQAAMDMVRAGVDKVVPLVALRLFTWEELEVEVCGRPGLDIPLLQQHTVYAGGFHERSPAVRYFWQVLEALTPMQQGQVLRFVWARTRLPSSVSGFSRPFTISCMARSNADAFLPQAHTCMFQLDLPNYSSAAVLRRQLILAAECCICYDLDGE